MELTNKKNIMLNCLKGLACIGVIFVHEKLPGKIGIVVSEMFGFSVPLFLMIAGYYSLGADSNKIKRRLLKIINIFFRAITLFLIYEIFNHIRYGGVIDWLLSLISVKRLIDLVIFCNIDFAIPLWYLIAMIEIYILWFFVVKKGKENSFVKLIPLLLICQIILHMVYDTLKLSWSYQIKFLAAGLFWFVLGYYIHQNEEIFIKKIKNNVLLLVAIIGFLVDILSNLSNIYIKFSCIGVLIYSVAMFLIGVNNSNKSLCKTLEYIGNNLSLNIYIIHTIISRILISLLEVFKFDRETSIYPWISPFIVAGISIAICFVIDILKNKKKKKVLY